MFTRWLFAAVLGLSGALGGCSEGTPSPSVGMGESRTRSDGAGGNARGGSGGEPMATDDGSGGRSGSGGAGDAGGTDQGSGGVNDGSGGADGAGGTDGSGGTDGAGGSDGAGGMMPVDACPDDPDKTEPGICGCGTPESDGDSDGVLDCVDDCPVDPSRTDDVDSDGDGQLDCVDVCPDDPTDNASPRAMTASPGTCTWATHCSHGYWFCTNNRDLDQARPLCQGIGGDMLSINNQPEQDFARTHATGGNQWIVGLNKINLSGSHTDGVWEWVDGTLAMGGFENWRNGEPDNNDCGAIDSGLWIDWTCGNNENWICEVP